VMGDKLGGASAPSLRSLPPLTKGRSVVPVGERLANLRHALTLDLPHFRGMTRHGGRLLIAAGGPSLQRNLPKLRRAHRKSPLWAVNGVGNYLLSRAIKADAMVFCDPQE